MKKKFALITVMAFLLFSVSGCTGIIRRFLPDQDEIIDRIRSAAEDILDEESSTDSPAESDYSSEETEGPPRTDVDGSDLDYVPRYPGSVMTKHSEIRIGDASVMDLVYIVHDASLSDVRDYYDSALLDYDWEIVVSALENGNFGMQAIMPGEESFVVITARHSNRYSGYTEINISQHKE